MIPDGRWGHCASWASFSRSGPIWTKQFEDFRLRGIGIDAHQEHPDAVFLGDVADHVLGPGIGLLLNLGGNQHRRDERREAERVGGLQRLLVVHDGFWEG